MYTEWFTINQTIQLKLCIVVYLKTPPLGRRDGIMIFKDYSAHVFLLEFLTLAYLAGAKEVHEISNLFYGRRQASVFLHRVIALSFRPFFLTRLLQRLF